MILPDVAPLINVYKLCKIKLMDKKIGYQTPDPQLFFLESAVFSKIFVEVARFRRYRNMSLILIKAGSRLNLSLKVFFIYTIVTKYRPRSCKTASHAVISQISSAYKWGSLIGWEEKNITSQGWDFCSFWSLDLVAVLKIRYKSINTNLLRIIRNNS